jgi:hypothetical protein
LIKELWAAKKYSQVRIARATGLNNGTVSKILSGPEPKRWGKKDLIVDWEVLEAPRRKPACHNRILTDAQVLAIIAAKGKERSRALALLYGVSRSYVKLLWSGYTLRAQRLIEKQVATA